MPSRSLDSLQNEAYRIFPGAALALIIAAASHRLIAEYLPVSSFLVAILAGVVLRALGWVPAWAEDGLRRASGFPLRMGIVLLGLQLAVGDVLGLGAGVIAVLLATVAVTWVGMRLLGPVFRVDPTTTILLSTGTAVCGASAVVATASVLDRGDGCDRRGRPLQSATATALAAVTMYGTVLMLVLPAVANLLGLSQHQAGIWMGVSIHEVGQVVAAGGILGATALATATVVKLARVLILAPLVVGLRLREAKVLRKGSEENQHIRAVVPSGQSRRTWRIQLLMPWFVVGFVLAVALNSWADIPAETAHIMSQVTTMLITVAMVGIGTSVDLRELRRNGGPALLLGAAGTIIITGTALVGVWMVGI